MIRRFHYATSVAEDLKECTHCREKKPDSAFNSNGRGGVRAWCRMCTKNKDRAYRYGMTQDEYEARLAAQCYVCAVCREPFTDENVPCVDHDHSCCPGRVGCGRCNRGLVCRRCNKALGLLEDDPDLFEAAVEYLTRE